MKLTKLSRKDLKEASKLPVNFYSSLGFEKEGFLKSHYAKGEDLVVMSKFLQP